MRRKLKIALFGELSLEEAIDLSGDRQIHDDDEPQMGLDTMMD
jgi:hypothetical protein